MDRSGSTAAQTLAALEPLMRKVQARGSPEDFYWTVNRVFHAEEAAVYDRIHRNMWASLPHVWRLLSDELVAHASHLPPALSVLDVGCGTGMAAMMLLNTILGRRVASLTMLDPSPEMLAQARVRATGRRIPVRCIQGTFQQLGREPFDLVVASSVLHHVADLPGFLREVQSRQHPGGVFVHVQDPNPAIATDVEFACRCDEIAGPMRWRSRRTAIVARIRRTLGRAEDLEEDYVARVNRRLLGERVIGIAMSGPEIWSVTDIHVPGLPFSSGGGIGRDVLRRHLPGYREIVWRSYGFWGQLWADLPRRYRSRELKLLAAGAGEGAWVAGAWSKEFSA